MQSTGQTSTQEQVFDVDAGLGDDVRHGSSSSSGRVLYRRRPARRSRSMAALQERRFHHHLVEPRGVRAAQPVRVRVVREAEHRHVRIRVGDLVRVDARDVRDHESGVSTCPSSPAGDPEAALRACRGRRDRPQPAGSSPPPRAYNAVNETALDTNGLELLRRGEYFAAHEELETAWRAAEPASATSSRGSSTSPWPGTRPVAAGGSAASASWRRPRGGCRPTRPPTAASTCRPFSRRSTRSASASPPARSTLEPVADLDLAEPDARRARLTMTRSHQSRWKKSSRPSATSVAPLTTRITA